MGTVLLIEDGLMEVKVTESPGSIQEATGRTVVRSYACGPGEEVFGFAKRGLRLPKGSTKRLKLIRAYLIFEEGIGGLASNPLLALLNFNVLSAFRGWSQR